MQEAKTLKESIDYSKSIQLIVIAPNFHRDNFTDKKYNQLPIQFLQFEILEQSEEFYFVLTDTDSQETKEIKIKSEIKTVSEQGNKTTQIPEPPRNLLKLLASVDITEDDRKIILAIREQVLGFSDRIKEFSGSSNTIQYGTSKNKLCAELREDKVRNTVALFLWLPHVTSQWKSAKPIVARMRIWTDWTSISAVGHIPKAIGRMISFDEYYAASVSPLNKLLDMHHGVNKKRLREKYFNDKNYRESVVSKRKYLGCKPHYTSGLAMFPEEYFKFIDRIGHSLVLQDLVNLALETWSKKL